MSAAAAPGGNAGAQDLTVVEILRRLRVRWRLLAGAALVGGALGAGLAYVLPVSFTANTKILPPTQGQQGAGAALLAQLGGLANLAGAGGVLKTPADLYVGLLRTRTIADRVIQQFDLQAAYEQKLMSAVRRRLASNTVITVGKDGLISIDVDDADPVRAAGMANAYVTELIAMSKTMALTEAAQRRLFFEGQLAEANAKLATAQDAARSALGHQGLQAIEVQGRTVLETSARLRAQIAVQEVRLAAASNRLTPENAEYRAMQDELAALRRELATMESGPAVSSRTPSTSTSTATLLRDAKYYENLYELLAKQLEAAKLDEARQPAVVQVVDAAEVPDRKSKPQGSLIVLGLLSAFLLMGAFYAALVPVRRSEAAQ